MTTGIRIILFSWFLLFSTLVSGQQQSFKRYSNFDGLNSNNVTALYRDSYGILWIGTPSGINWFDGTHFIQPDTFSRIEHKFINNFIEDSHHNIWITTFFDGLFRFSHSGLYHYGKERFKDSLVNSTFEVVEIDSITYLIGTDHGAFMMHNNTCIPFDDNNQLLKGQIESISRISGKGIFIASNRGLFWYKKKDKKWYVYKYLLQGFIINKILAVENNLWVATNDGVLFLKVTGGDKAAYSTSWKLKNVAIKNLRFSNGYIWALDQNAYKIKGNHIESFGKVSGLPADLITTALTDREGINWFGTDKGLFKLDEEYFSYDPVLSNLELVIAIWQDNQSNTWLGTFDGLVKMDGHRVTPIKKINDKKLGFIYSIFKSCHNKVIALSSAGILSLDGQPTIISPIEYRCHYEDSSGQIYLGTKNGVITMYDGKKFKNLKNSAITNDIISCIFKKGPFIYVGYNSSGLNQYFIDNDSLILKRSVVIGKDPLRIRSFLSYKNKLIYGTRNDGLFIFNEALDSLPIHINFKNGLVGNWIKDMSTDSLGNLVLATDNGIDILQGNDIEKPTIIAVIPGNINFPTEVNCIYINGDNYFFGSKGLIRFFPDKYFKRSIKPIVYITHLSIPGMFDSTISPYWSQRKSLQLTYNNNKINFDFTCTGLKDETHNKYRYYLQGLDSSWSAITSKNSVSYERLPAGSYTFKVYGYNSDGIESEKAATVFFVISPAIWKTPWFMALELLLSLFLLFCIYRYRLRQVLKVERLRHRISSDLHDEIGSTLSSISILSDLVLKGKDKAGETGMLVQIKESSIDLLEKMDDIIWSINPQNDSLENLLLRIRKFSAQIFEAKQIEYLFIMPEGISRVDLSMSYRQHIYLIIKESINNLVKYSKASKVEVEIGLIKKKLEVRISDNGKGFEQNVTKGNGIPSMKLRATQMKSQLDVVSKIGQGTTIKFSIKIV